MAALALGDLLDELRTRLNTPGDTSNLFIFAGAEDDWILALAGGFWTIRSRGFFTDFRVDRDDLEVVNINGGDDMTDEQAHLIVLQTALDKTRSKYGSLFTVTRDKSAAGSETERQRSSTLLKALLDDIRTELESIRTEAVNGDGTTVHVIDAILTRSGVPFPLGPTAPWIR